MPDPFVVIILNAYRDWEGDAVPVLTPITVEEIEFKLGKQRLSNLKTEAK